uniref:IS5 family transposase n=1 Tax=Escherichia coli TaxID=562 RepID=A0A6F8QL92_ECOLX|nr:IS5 family transposase [Escherichia coli]
MTWELILDGYSESSYSATPRFAAARLPWFKITNWPTYNKALINRGSITFWLDDEAIQAWYESATPSSRGRPQRYSDLAITTVLVIKRVFRLTLRAAQGFIDSIFSLMNVPLRCPDYSCVSRRAKSVNMALLQIVGGDKLIIPFC